MKELWSVMLSNADRQNATHDVEKRQSPKREFGVVNQKVDSTRSDFTIDFLGVLAEIAVARMLGILYDDEGKLGGDDGFDLRWRGTSIEIKFTFYPNGHLIVLHKHKIKADRFILVTGNYAEMRLIGWVDRSEFLKHGEYMDFGFGPSFALNRKNLRPMDEFDPLLMKIHDMYEPNGGERYGTRKGTESAEAV